MIFLEFLLVKFQTCTLFHLYMNTKEKGFLADDDDDDDDDRQAKFKKSPLRCYTWD